MPSASVKESLKEWVVRGLLQRHSKVVFDVVHCTWQRSERDKLKGDRKNNLSLNRVDDDKYLSYKDDITAVLLESFPRSSVRVNMHPSAVPRPPIGAFEILLRVGPGEEEEAVVFSKLDTRRWPNCLNMQRLFETALGQQRVTIGITVVLGSNDPDERHAHPTAHPFKGRELNSRQHNVEREWGHGGLGGWKVLPLQKLHLHSVKGEMMQANAHTAGTVFLDLLEEDLPHVVARHGGERVSEQGTLISADERGMAEVRVRARGLYLVTTKMNERWLYGFLSTERSELEASDRVHRSLVIPPSSVLP